MAPRRKHADAPLPRRQARPHAPPPRNHDRRLRRRLPGGQGTHVRHLGLAARRASLAPGAALFPRPRRQPDRAELAGRGHARPVALPGAPPDRRPHSAEARCGGSRPLPRRQLMDSALRRPGMRSKRRGLTAAQVRVLRIAGWAVLAALAVLPVLWVLFFAPTTGKFATSFGSAVHDPKDFLITMLNGVTAAGLYFVVSSGFTLIFGLMRVVNMAHGAFFLLGGYVALKLQRHMVGGGSSFGLTSSQVNLTHWLVPALAGTALVAGAGLVMQQLFLRWTQGQDLRQALITIAISIILADQMLAHFGGVAEDIAWPRNFDTFTNVHVAGIQYTLTRLVILGFALTIGLLLWVWLKRTRTGMVIRAGVDDRAMVSALGINIQLTFAIAFVVGSGLAGLGGVIGGSFAGLAPGVDANWLLYSLVVVIIGGMGSLGGVAIGALLPGFTSNFSAASLPSNYTYYSIIFTFVLVAFVLAVRPLGLFGRPA